MGLESYSFKMELLYPKNKQVIFNELIKLKFIISGNSLGFVYLEKAYDFGYIEVALKNSDLNIIVPDNEINYQNEFVDQVDVKQLLVRIAKPNHENIIDCFINDLTEFNKSIPVKVTNLQSKKQVDLNDYEDLKKHYINTRNEFKQYYPIPTYPIRCRDVYKSNS